MNHLWIAYDSLLVGMSMANLVLFYLARDRKPFLTPLSGFYATFALSIVIELLRRYMTFNVGAAPVVAFLSYGANTALGFAALMWCLPMFHRLLGTSSPRVSRGMMCALGVAALCALSPWSVQFHPEAQSYLLKPGHHAAMLVYLAVFIYVIYLAVAAMLSARYSDDRWLTRGLLVFAVVGMVESTIAAIAAYRNPTGSLGAEGEQFLFSSLPYAALSVMLAVYLLKILGASRRENHEIAESTFVGLKLSDRETEVVKLLLTGLSNKLIAKQLNISEATVKTHLNKAFRKANVKSRFELTQKLVTARPGG